MTRNIQRSTLVPARLMDGKDPRCFLSTLYDIGPEEHVDSISFATYDAELVYVVEDGRPQLADLIDSLQDCPEHNRIVCRYEGGVLYLAIAQGERLQLANTYPAVDFTTAEYYIFLAIKTLQINPELSTIRFMSPLDEEQEISLGRYFRAVESV